MEKNHDEFKLMENQWQYVLKERKMLQNKLDGELPYVRKGFLLRLFLGHFHSYSQSDLLERMSDYGWDVENKKFVVMNMRLTGFFNSEGKFLRGDERLVTFAAANVLEELAANHFDQIEFINFHDLSIGILLIIPQQMDVTGQLQSFCTEMMTAINHLLHMWATISISRSTESIIRISSFFEEVKRITNFRVFENQNQVIDLEQQPFSEPEDKVDYPFDLEREIIQALRMGREEEAGNLVSSFMQYVSEKGMKEIVVQQSMLQLLGSIQHVMIQSGVYPHVLFNGTNMFVKLSQIHESQDMQKWMKEQVIHPFMKELSQVHNMQMKKMVEIIIDHIHSSYMTEISLDSCADLVGTNSYTLSRAFKQVCGINFIDYVTEFRMEKAKEMLRTTDWKVSVVSSNVGYQPSYFNRIFRKYEGMPPSKYRKMYQ